MFFDPIYFLFIIPPFLLSLWASFYTKSTFKKFSKIAGSHGFTGAQAAHEMLRCSGVTHCSIEMTHGFLSDHYDPSTRTLRLSEQVFHSNSLSAVGIACHEAGHALQHAEAYGPLKLRSAMVPMFAMGDKFSYFIIIIGLFMHSRPLVLGGIILFSMVFLFTLVTLPVEWDASARAKKAMISSGLLHPQEVAGAGKVLNAAFLTYLAAAITSLVTLLYYILRYVGMGRR